MIVLSGILRTAAVLLLLLVFLVLMVLLVPVRYQAAGWVEDPEGMSSPDFSVWKQKAGAELRFSWLLHLVQGRFCWNPQPEEPSDPVFHPDPDSQRQGEKGKSRENDAGEEEGKRSKAAPAPLPACQEEGDERGFPCYSEWDRQDHRNSAAEELEGRGDSGTWRPGEHGEIHGGRESPVALCMRACLDSAADGGISAGCPRGCEGQNFGRENTGGAPCSCVEPEGAGADNTDQTDTGKLIPGLRLRHGTASERLLLQRSSGSAVKRQQGGGRNGREQTGRRGAHPQQQL